MKDNKTVAVVLVLVIVIALAFVIYKVATGKGGDVEDAEGAPVSDTLELQPGATLPDAPKTPPPGVGG